MLKFFVGREQGSFGEGVVVRMGRRGALWVLEPKPFDPDSPDLSLDYVVTGLGCGDGHLAASLLHAIEVGIEYSARWIAVELLKNPEPQDGEPGVMALWLRPNEEHDLSLCAVLTPRGKLGEVGAARNAGWEGDASCWWASCSLATTPVLHCAGCEHAVALVIEHAAPWIAAALVKQFED